MGFTDGIERGCDVCVLPDRWHSSNRITQHVDRGEG
jgi:hypothetical protein